MSLVSIAKPCSHRSTCSAVVTRHPCCCAVCGWPGRRAIRRSRRDATRRPPSVRRASRRPWRRAAARYAARPSSACARAAGLRGDPTFAAAGRAARRAELPSQLELRAACRTVQGRDVLAAVRTERDRAPGGKRFTARTTPIARSGGLRLVHRRSFLLSSWGWASPPELGRRRRGGCRGRRPGSTLPAGPGGGGAAGGAAGRCLGRSLTLPHAARLRAEEPGADTVRGSAGGVGRAGSSRFHPVRCPDSAARSAKARPSTARTA